MSLLLGAVWLIRIVRDFGETGMAAGEDLIGQHVDEMWERGGRGTKRTCVASVRLQQIDVSTQAHS
jgi:hypothetical protein